MDAPITAAPNATATPVVASDLPQHVAETMRRVQAELRSGGTPSYEALLVYGAPGVH